MSEINLYNQNGKPIAYIMNESDIYLFDGKPVAYLAYGNCVYTYLGEHIGWYEKGWIIDLSGKYLYFSRDAVGGPLKPMRQIEPIKGIRQIKPIKNIKEIRHLKSVRILSWSDLDENSFFGN